MGQGKRIGLRILGPDISVPGYGARGNCGGPGAVSDGEQATTGYTGPKVNAEGPAEVAGHADGAGGRQTGNDREVALKLGGRGGGQGDGGSSGGNGKQAAAGYTGAKINGKRPAGVAGHADGAGDSQTGND